MKKLLLGVDRKISIPVFFNRLYWSSYFFCRRNRSRAAGIGVSIGEKLAVSYDAKSADLGYRILQDMDAKPELEAASAGTRLRPLSIASSFLPINQQDAEKMYFFVAGRAHKEADQTIDNSQNVKQADPNAKVVGLTLAESKISGHVDANALTAVTYWTMVFGKQLWCATRGTS